MPTTKQTTNSGTETLDSTRRLLDELETLMQRMLELPVADEKGELTPGGPNLAQFQTHITAETNNDDTPDEDVDVPEDIGEEQLELTPTQASQPVVYTVDDDAQWEKMAPPVRDVSMKQSDAGAGAPGFDLARLPAPINTERMAPRKGSGMEIPPGSLLDRARQEVAETNRRYGWLLWPVRLINRTFDALTMPLGPIGRLLRSGVVRNVLGWLGIILLVLAFAWQIYTWVAWKP